MMNNKGFTLSELLIFVATVGILAVIAIPQFQNYKDNETKHNRHVTMNQVLMKVETHVRYLYPEVSDVRTKCNTLNKYYSTTCISTALLDGKRITYDTYYVDGVVHKLGKE